MTRIFFICPDEPSPSGGILKLYRQVEILNQNGWEAYIFHSTFKFRCNWFSSTAPIVYSDLPFAKRFADKIKKYRKEYIHLLFRRRIDPELQIDPLFPLITESGKQLPSLSSKDILVFPEFNAVTCYSKLKHFPYVIFNQNSYLTFREFSLRSKPFLCVPDKSQINPYHSSNLLGIMVVSKDNAEYLHYAFPHLTIKILHNSIDPKIFSPGQFKKKQIAFMPRRHKDDASRIINILRERKALEDWRIVPVDNISQKKVAEILKESILFLSFSEREGCPLPPAEAMACGCVVVGYHGQGGKEYLIPPFAYPIMEGEIVNYAKAVEKIAKQYETNPEAIIEEGRQASQYILSHYTLEQEEKDVLSFWNQLNVK